MNETKLFKAHQKVAEALGIDVPNIEDIEYSDNPLVPIPNKNEVAIIDNSELPNIVNELTRLEHALRQTEFLIEQALPVVQQSLAESLLMPPQFKARSIEANSKLLEVSYTMIERKADLQLRIMELKLKLDAYGKEKSQSSTTVSGNTFVFANREELIKSFAPTVIEE